MKLADYHVPGETTKVVLTLEEVAAIKKRRALSPSQPRAKINAYAVEVVPCTPLDGHEGEFRAPQLGTEEGSTRAKTGVEAAMGMSLDAASASASPQRSSSSIFFLEPDGP